MPFTKPWPEACLLCIVHSDGAVALCGDDTVEQQDEDVPSGEARLTYILDFSYRPVKVF
jgi:hypothetical protein|tara:strand:- start:227 stop:403 length:177 start_codon:yes stop_codon:yes gene_type:complete